MPAELQQRKLLARRLALAIVAPLVVLLAVGVVVGRQILAFSGDAAWVDRADEVIAVANGTLRQVLEQESALRGYLLSGDRSELAAFTTVHPKQGFERLHSLVLDGSQRLRFDRASHDYEAWLASTATILDGTQLETAKSVVAMRARRAGMDSVLHIVDEALAIEAGLRDSRATTAAASLWTTKFLVVFLLGGSALVLALVTRQQSRAVAHTLGAALTAEARARAQVEEEAWLRSGQGKLTDALQGEKTVHELGTACLSALASYTRADIGAFFTKETGLWRQQAGYTLDPRAEAPDSFAEGEGIVGRVAADRQLLHLQQVPPNFLKIRSGTGESGPADVVVLPACIEGTTSAVIELGFLRVAEPRTVELLGRVGENVALAVRSSEYKQRLRDLVAAGELQGRALQTQQEELRVINEELETQASFLRSTQALLETQKNEVDQTNLRLVGQALIVEEKNKLLATTHAAIAASALEMERATRFKSEFLSNMSHELRTPLNSLLILARLLADNRDGNLSAEQVKFALTIYGAGNDLLGLIGEILDLSKIESGNMDVHVESVTLERVRETLLRTFEPAAKEKGLRFGLTVDAGVPLLVETDGQRLEQILKNLVANAMKFTERGRVLVDVAASGEGITFAVCDTGIGIPREQQQIIFEAFRQADGTTNRKYGGTGLGLSISRQLAHLLGGNVTVASEPGKGSTFTLWLPRAYAGPVAGAEAAPPLPVPPKLAPLAAADRDVVSSSLDDGVGAIEPGRHIVLVIEDDGPFAHVLADVAREAGFHCLQATTAEEGIRLVKKYAPIGVVLDIHLPDQSGLSVLERLKRDPTTRHIPIHVISASDHTEAALSMGATGYLLKPVKREQLLVAFQALGGRSAHRVRRVLVVEDDAALREGISSLLASRDVEISTAGSVSEALALLPEHKFECIVTDLGLPDQSAYDMLETMAASAPYTMPPVIVYTGRALTADQEQRLRKYSRSIIVKGARSHERLLDEVTLFLHQVESELPPGQQQMLKQARHREGVFEGRTVLIVEDDVRNVFALTSVLEPKGARVVIARNGREALAALAKEPRVDLVLMDTMMPEMDGLEATREIRKDPRWARLPIIAVTAKAMPDDHQKCLAAGANDYLAKPLDIDVLLSLLRVWMPRR